MSGRNGVSLLAAAVAGAGVAALLLNKKRANASSGGKAAVEKESQEWMVQQQDRAGKLLVDSKSTYFAGVPQYKVVMTEGEIDQAVRKVAALLNSQFKGEKLVLVGILKGAFIFMSNLVRYLTRPYSIYFVEASSYKGQKQSDDVELLSRIVPEKFQGRRVILVDELLDNGLTMHSMKEYLVRKLNMERSNIVKCVLFSKENERRDPKFNADIVGIEDLPDLWLVGYGLDDDGTKRGWPLLYAKQKAPGIPLCVDDDVFSEDPDKAEQVYASIRQRVVKHLSAQIAYKA